MVPFYHPRIFERVNIALLDLFDRVKVNRYNRDGTVRKRIRVPLTFHFSKNFADFVLNTQDVPESKHTYPILGLRMGGLERNAGATPARTQIREIYDRASKQMIQDARPSPWVQTYTLTSYTEQIQDHFQMMEQIIPYFNPTFNTTIKEFEFSNLKRDIIVELVGVAPQYNDEVDREKARSYVCEYTFKVKFDMYSPFYLGTLIKEINNKIALSGKPIELIRSFEAEDITIDEYNDILQEMILANMLADDVDKKNIDLGDELFNPSGVQASTGNQINTVVASGIKVENQDEFVKYFDINANSQTELITIPAGKKIISASVAVIDPYNKSSSNVSIGTLENRSSIMASRDSNLSLATKYEIEFDPVKLIQDTTLYVFYDRREATVGSFEVTIKWA